MMSFSPTDNNLAEALLEEVPCGIMIIDRDLVISGHNHAFAEVFGESQGQRCYRVFKNRATPCEDCAALLTFEDGKRRIQEETGTDQAGKTIHCLSQLCPILDQNNEIQRVASFTTDLTRTRRLQQEYQTLFEKVPCYVAVLNRERRVVKANEMFRRVFG